MAKRLMVLVTVFLSLALLNVVQAVGVDTGPAALAPYFSADTEMFISLRIDNDFIDELDSLLGSVMAKLPADMEIPPVSIRQNLEAALADATAQQGVDFSLDALQTWMGDYAAMGVTGILGQTPNTRTVIQIRDRGAAEAFADELIAVNPEDFAYTRTTVDGVTRYEQPEKSNAVVLIDDTTMIITDSESENFSMSLDSSEGFQTTVKALPAESYNILTFINVAAATVESPVPELANIASASVGLTILDNHNLTADIALATTNGVASPITAVDPTFARFLPADTSLLIHSTNLTALYDLAMAQAQRMDAENDLDAQVTSMLSMLGIDLRDDLLSWSTGDYALFSTLDYAGIRNMVFSPNDIPDALPAGFGLLIEATDPAAAHSFAEKLTPIITQLTANQKNITLSSDSVAGNDVTRLAMQTPMDDGTLLE
ncbi:MAG: DUF3352 domain-containing protein, partial [Anaerolineae bacterium]|nr:DUF3352 domain-containing protein [Anaerolineae bacterium]